MNKKLHYLTAAAIAAAVVFAECKKDDDDKLTSGAFDGKITATVEKGNAYNSLNSKVNKVSVMVHYYDIYEDVEFASGTYANGNFTLTLPQPASKYLFPFWDEEKTEIPAGVNISENVKVFEVDMFDFEVYDSVNPNNYERRSSLAYGKVGNNSYTQVVFVYADKDFTVTGSSKEEDDKGKWEDYYSMSFKKGWNIAYWTETVSGEWVIFEGTTKPVSGVKWYFLRDFDDAYEAAFGAKSKAHKSSVKRLFSKK